MLDRKARTIVRSSFELGGTIRRNACRLENAATNASCCLEVSGVPVHCSSQVVIAGCIKMFAICVVSMMMLVLAMIRFFGLEIWYTATFGMFMGCLVRRHKCTLIVSNLLLRLCSTDNRTLDSGGSLDATHCDWASTQSNLNTNEISHRHKRRRHYIDPRIRYQHFAFRSRPMPQFGTKGCHSNRRGKQHHCL